MANILLVDDDASMRSMVARALTNDGHHVTEAEDGEMALAALAKSTDVTLLLTDVQMPGMDGLTLATKARAKLPTLRVILISALAQNTVETGNLGPSVRWLAKPFTLDRIRTEVRAALA